MHRITYAQNQLCTESAVHRRQPRRLKVHAGWMLMVEDANAVCLTAQKLPFSIKAERSQGHCLRHTKPSQWAKHLTVPKIVQSSMEEGAAA